MTARSQLEQLFQADLDRQATAAADRPRRPMPAHVRVLPEKPADCPMSDEEWMILAALGIVTWPPRRG